MIFGDLTKKAEKQALELAGDDAERKLRALEVLNGIAQEDVRPLKLVVAALVEALGDESIEVRVGSMRLLQTMARARAGLKKDIMKGILDNLPKYGEFITEALAFLQKHASSAKDVVEENLPALVALLEGENEGARDGAIIVLEEIGIPAQSYATGMADAKLVLEDAGRCGAELEKADYMLKAARSGMKKGFYEEVGKDLELAKELANNGRRVVRQWRFQLQGAVALDISPAGRFICACGGDRKLYLIDAAGKMLWAKDIPEGAACLSISPDGMAMVVGGGDGRLHCFGPDGTRLWEFRMGAPAISMDISESGTVIASGGDNNIHVIGPGGSQAAKHWTEKALWHLGVSGDGENIIATFKDHNVYCYDHNLFLRWKFMGGIWNDVGISRDGETLVAGSHGNDVVVFSKMGVVMWKARSDEPVSHLAISAAGDCIYAADARSIYSFNRAGKLMFKYATREPVLSLACSADGEYIAAGFADRIVLMRNREMVRQMVQQSGIQLENVQRLGVDIQGPASLLEKSKASFEAGDYENGTEIAARARLQLEAAKTQRAEALISSARQVIDEAASLGGDMAKSEALVHTAQESLKKGQLDRVLLLLGQAREEAEISRRVREEMLKADKATRAQNARKAIQEAIALTDEAVDLGMESGRAEILLQKAIAASEAGDYERAVTFTRQLEEHVKEEKARLPAKMEKGFRTALELVAKETLTPEETERARLYLSGAIVYYEKAGELKKLAEAYERFGFLEEKRGKIPYSKFLYQKAVNCYFRAGEIDQVLMLLVEKLKRLEAISDKKVGEYTIEELFLIYRDGRLIHHNTRRLRPEVDNQVLGGMLVAIQHFVADSFKEKEPEKTEILNELRYGKTRIVVEAGKFVYLALVFSGQEPEDMRQKMKKIVLDIEDKYKTVLETWNGEASKLWGAKKMVEPLISGF
jgi:outer membrane protein assembly factor BamB